MASTFSPSLKLELMANGDQSGTWGSTTNTNLGTLLEQAIVGVQPIVMVDADHTLTNFNGASDEARNAVLVVTGTNSAIRNIITPSGQQKTYIVSNGTAGGFAINIKAGAGGTPLAISSGITEQVYTDGTNFYQVGMTSFKGGTTGLTPSTPASGDVTLGGTLNAASGGTGLSSPAANSVLLSNGSSALQTVAPGTSGYILTSNGTTWVSAPNGGGGAGVSSVGLSAPSIFTVTGSPVTSTGTLTLSYSGSPLPAANGGTGSSSTPTVGALVYGNGASYSLLAPGTAGTTLISNGTGYNPSWSSSPVVTSVLGTTNQITASTVGTTVTLSLPTLTAGYIPYGNGTGAFSSSANMTFDGSTLTTLNSAYTGTLTGGTGIVNLGSGQFYKDTSGNVGIGTSSPTCKLDVVNNSNADLNAHIYNANAGSSARSILVFGNDISSSVSSLVQNSSTSTAFGGAGALNLYLGTSNPLTFSTAGTERMRIDGSGNVLVGTTSTTPTNSSVQINGGIVIAGGYRTHNGSSGSTWQNSFNLYWTGSATQLWIDTTNQGTITVVSDYRLKDNVVTQSTSAIDRIQQLRPVTYTYKDYEPFSWKADGINREGFIAHELQEIIPSAVEGEKDAENQIQSLKLDALCSVMVKAIQELKAIVDTQAEQITALNAKVGI